MNEKRFTMTSYKRFTDATITYQIVRISLIYERGYITFTIHIQNLYLPPPCLSATEFENPITAIKE